jgi:hypothetical protein
MVTGEKPNVVGMLDTGQARTALEQVAAKEEIVPNARDFRYFSPPGRLSFLCSVRAVCLFPEGVRAWLQPACRGGAGARFHGPRGPAGRAGFLLPDVGAGAGVSRSRVRTR